jgi:hypothetical protein
VLLCHVTSHVEGDKHQGLWQEKGGSGFPFLVFMDAEGNVVAKQGERTVAGFQVRLAACKAYLELAAKHKAGDESVAADLLIARIELDQVDFAAAKQEAETLGRVDAAKQKKIDGLLLDLEVFSIVRSARAPAAAKESGAKFLEMMKAGRVPTGPIARNFYAWILPVAEAAGDAASYEQALTGFKQFVGDNRAMQEAVELFEQRLAKLKGAGGGK